MKMSVREARANFATAIEAAERGEHVVITKNGKPVAEMGPPAAKKGLDWDGLERFRKERGWDKLKPEEVWPSEFDYPAFSRKVLGIGEDWDPARK
jgi:antitoxin (DNA-binding transcriptional repressor) of toxin-antitoxin stability system